MNPTNEPLMASPSVQPPRPARVLDDQAEDVLEPARVMELFGLLEKSVRAHRLYQSNNPVYQGFIASLRAAFRNLWTEVGSLRLALEEGAFRWAGRTFTVGEGRDSLSFLFFKDGVRSLTFLPGFEDEVEVFLEVVHAVRQAEQTGDDVVTLLWEQQFASFQYGYVDVLAEGLEIPRESAPELECVDIGLLEADLSGADGEPPRPSQLAQATAPAPPPGMSREEFEETLYFLDEPELQALQQEVELEWTRDLKADVLSALLDRLEDPLPARQSEILGILRQLLPAFLSRGDLTSGSRILLELSDILEDEELLSPEQREDVQRIFSELRDPAVIAQLIRSLEDAVIDPEGEELGVFLRHLGPASLPLLIRSVETTPSEALRNRLGTAIQSIAREHPDDVIELLRSDEPVVAGGAARLLGQMALPRAAQPITQLLQRDEPALRLAAVEALVAIHSGPAMEALEGALEDPEREVRVAAARGFARLRYQPARPRLEEMLRSRTVKEADLTEKIAFFEAFGAVANADSVGFLDRLLNGRNVLRQRQAPELRACAALALGRMNTPGARAALERCADEANPMVRNAVARALRQEASV